MSNSEFHVPKYIHLDARDDASALTDPPLDREFRGIIRLDAPDDASGLTDPMEIEEDIPQVIPQDLPLDMPPPQDLPQDIPHDQRTAMVSESAIDLTGSTTVESSKVVEFYDLTGSTTDESSGEVVEVIDLISVPFHSA